MRVFPCEDTWATDLDRAAEFESRVDGPFSVNSALACSTKPHYHCHKLRIKTGRYDNIPCGERLCSLCNWCACKTIEDESLFASVPKLFLYNRYVLY